MSLSASYWVVNAPLRVMVMAAVLLVAGCGTQGGGSTASTTSTPNTAAGTFTLTDSGCRYDGLAQLSSGRVTANIANQTADRAHFDFWKLQPGHDYAELAAYLSEGGRRLRSKEPPLGHPAFASLVSSTLAEARAGGVLRADLGAGRYGMACIRWKLTEEGPLDMYPAGPLDAKS